MTDRSKSLIAMKKELDDREFHILQSELERRKKSVSLAYVLWFFLSFLGIHKFYLGKISQGILYVIAPSIAVIFLVIGAFISFDPLVETTSEELTGGEFLVVIGGLGLFIYGVWWFIDLFTIPNQVNKYNEDIEIETIESLSGKSK